jgi:hypothetical protein
MQKMEQLRECLPNIQDLPRDDQESNSYADRNTSDDNHLLSEAASASQRSKMIAFIVILLIIFAFISCSLLFGE